MYQTLDEHKITKSKHESINSYGWQELKNILPNINGKYYAHTSHNRQNLYRYPSYLSIYMLMMRAIIGHTTQKLDKNQW